MFRSWGAIGSPIFAEIEGGRGQNGTFLGDFTRNDPNVNAKQAFQKRNKSISRMLHGENRPVTSNLAVEVIAGGFNMAVEVVGEILTSEGSVQSHSVGNAVYYVRDVKNCFSFLFCPNDWPIAGAPNKSIVVLIGWWCPHRPVAPPIWQP